MKNMDIQKILVELSDKIDVISNQDTCSTLKTILNLVETLAEDRESLRKENQLLKDEINRLKGEQGKPNIRKQKQDQNDDSSEEERKKRTEKKKRKAKKKKKGNIKIDRKMVCHVDKSTLPEDAQFKGYDKRVFQDIKVITDNVEFSREVYYSPSLKKTFMADIPKGYSGEFGPGIRSLVITLYRDSGMTEPAIERFFKTFNVDISKTTISRMITEDHDIFHQEKDEIVSTGIQSSRYQHLDDTGSRVNGKNHYTHILCNPYYTAFFTIPKKDRLSVLGVLCNGELKFTFNEAACDLMTNLGLSEKQSEALKELSVEGTMTRKEVDHILEQLFPNPKKQQKNRGIILDASAIVYYQSLEHAIEFLICDDAPQFNMITTHKGLCWIHEGRHYKKLKPIVPLHIKILSDFREKFWDFYQELLEYKVAPSKNSALELTEKFDRLFSTVTGYQALDERIAMTLDKKESLLLVLTFPFLPLQNNPAELGARVQARIRDINLQTKSENGTKSKDTFATIQQTARKLGVNFYNYIFDRVSRKFEMTSLADLIRRKSKITPDTS